MLKRVMARVWLATGLLACLAAQAAQAAQPEPAGPARAPEVRSIRMVVTDLKTQAEVERDFAPFARLLGELAGMDVALLPARSRVEAVEAMRSGRIDLVLIGPAEYVVFRKRGVGQPLVGLTRPGYHSLIVTAAASPIQSLDELRGRKVVFGDVGSTSSHLGPMQILADHGLDPRLDVKAIHAEAVEAWAAVQRGAAAAMGTSKTYLDRIAAQDHEASAAMRVLAEGPELPGDVLLAGDSLTVPDREALRRALRERGDALLQALAAGPGNGKYRRSSFRLDVQDADFDVIRKMYATAGFPAYADFLEK